MNTKFSTIALVIVVLLFSQCGKDQGVNPGGESRLVVTEVVGPPNAEMNVAETYQVVIKNYGEKSDDTYEIKLYKTGDVELATLTASDPIDKNRTKTYDLTWTPSELEELRLYARVCNVGEDITEVDTSFSLAVYTFPENEKQYLIWDNDNDSWYYRPGGGLVQQSCEAGLVRALMDNDCDSHIVEELPRVLRNYDIVFIELGKYCPS